ncbi:hypothetical protein BDZ90DRAFT_277312 [Jaminaea rosea]|uniref:Uncharacterized protein n=1 Tax=Jaminaea rosea TaxID=1569628 RepID=A0A316V2X9_9BASI|nr:hypothetical protein BDZ90DRAFT_277312 [Jaminaea rosea]PWN30891.1 hypothetical protein BDZ90DRAFT_277312 [Jaminaea rosea]
MPFAETLILASLPTRKPKLGQVTSLPLSPPLSSKPVAVDSARAMFKPPAARAEKELATREVTSVAAGFHELVISERKYSDRVWDWAANTGSDFFGSSTTLLPGKTIASSFEEFKRLYNQLAADPRWWSRLNDCGLLFATWLVVREFFHLLRHAEPTDMQSVISSIDDRIGLGAITSFTLYKTDLVSPAGCAVQRMERQAIEKACRTPGLSRGCYRGSHLPVPSQMKPRIHVVKRGDGRTATLPILAARLELVPCARFLQGNDLMETVLLRANRRAKPKNKAAEIARNLFDSGRPGSLKAQDLLSLPLPHMGLAMSPLPDRGNRWLEAMLAADGVATASSIEVNQLNLALPMIIEYDQLVKGRIPALFDFEGVIDPATVRCARVDEAWHAGIPSLDRIVSRAEDGQMTPHSAGNVQWASWAYNRMKVSNSPLRAESSLALLLLHHNADVAQNDADSQSEDDEVDIGGDSDYGEDSDSDEEGESRSHGAARKLTSVGGTAAQLWSSIGKKVSPAWVARVAAGSTSFTCIHELIKSLPADLSDRLKDVGTMPNGLPTLGIFPQDTSETALRERLVSGIAFMEEKCEQLWPWVVPPAGLLGDDNWSASAESEHAKRSWHVGLTPANLFGALLMMFRPWLAFLGA